MKMFSEVINFILYFKIILLYFISIVCDSTIVVCTIDTFCAAPGVYSVTQRNIADDANVQQRSHEYVKCRIFEIFYVLFVSRFCSALWS